MIGVIMAGGKSTRMDLDHEKLLLKYRKPIILHVIDALIESKCFSKVIAITSSNAPKTRALLEKSSVEIFDTSGNGYVDDLNKALISLDDDVLVCSGDLPFLDSDIIKHIVVTYNPENIWTSLVVTKAFLDSINLSADFLISFKGQQCFFTGISLVNAKKIQNLNFVKEIYQIYNDKKIAFNLNTKQDYELLYSS